MPRTALAMGLVLSIGGWVICGCKDSKPQSSPQVEHPRTAGPPTASPPKANRQADNVACLDCHMDFADELISAKHLDKGFACTACHGESIAHGEDEGNVTKPDVLFGRTQITPFCRQCHPTHKSGAEYDAFVKKWRGQRRPTGVMLLDDATCTDCHGRHALAGEG